MVSDSPTITVFADRGEVERLQAEVAEQQDANAQLVGELLAARDANTRLHQCIRELEAVQQFPARGGIIPLRRRRFGNCDSATPLGNCDSQRAKDENDLQLVLSATVSAMTPAQRAALNKQDGGSTHEEGTETRATTARVPRCLHPPDNTFTCLASCKAASPSTHTARSLHACRRGC